MIPGPLDRLDVDDFAETDLEIQAFLRLVSRTEDKVLTRRSYGGLGSRRLSEKYEKKLPELREHWVIWGDEYAETGIIGMMAQEIYDPPGSARGWFW